MTNRAHIPELDGLRGLLAAWVFVFHALRFAGLQVPILCEGGLAVHVFIMLSGFMISRLRMQSHERYPIYLLRRLARLYPVYLMALSFGLAVSGLASSTFSHLPWEIVNRGELVRMHAKEQANLAPLLLAHLTMLHGMFPEEILPASLTAFIGPAWSLSLEWQFYLAAPMIVAVIASPRVGMFSIVVLLAVTVGATHFISGRFTYEVYALLPLMLPYFVVGIVSGLVFDHLREANPVLLGQVAGAIISIVIVIAPWWHSAIPFGMWIIAILAAAQVNLPSIRIISQMLSSPLFVSFGRVSYGFYLLHQPLMICVGAALLALGISARSPMLFGVLLIAFPLTWGVSALSFGLIEQPIMRLTSKFVRKGPHLSGDENSAVVVSTP